MIKRYKDLTHIRIIAKLNFKLGFLNEYMPSHNYDKYGNIRIELVIKNSELY